MFDVVDFAIGDYWYCTLSIGVDVGHSSFAEWSVGGGRYVCISSKRLALANHPSVVFTHSHTRSLTQHVYALSISAGISIPQKSATIGMAGVSVFVLLYLLSSIFWWTLFSSGFLVGIHGFLRDASMHKDMDDVVAMQGDLHLGEDASFLNSSNAV